MATRMEAERHPLPRAVMRHVFPLIVWVHHSGSGTLASTLMAHEYRDAFGASGVLGFVVQLLAGLARLLGRTLPG